MDPRHATRERIRCTRRWHQLVGPQRRTKGRDGHLITRPGPGAKENQAAARAWTRVLHSAQLMTIWGVRTAKSLPERSAPLSPVWQPCGEGGRGSTAPVLSSPAAGETSCPQGQWPSVSLHQLAPRLPPPRPCHPEWSVCTSSPSPPQASPHGSPKCSSGTK